MDKQERKMYVKELEERFFTIPLGVGFSLGGDWLLVDRETGIEYFCSGGHLTPLLDREGKPKLNQAFLQGRL